MIVMDIVVVDVPDAWGIQVNWSYAMRKEMGL